MKQEETGAYTTKDNILRCVADPRWFHGSKVGPKRVRSGLEVVLGMFDSSHDYAATENYNLAATTILVNTAANSAASCMANPVSICFNCQLPIQGLFPGLISTYDALYID